MIENPTHKDALKLAWAVFWRWGVLGLSVSLPMHFMKSQMAPMTANIVGGLVEPVLMFGIFWMTIFYLLKHGYKKTSLHISQKSNGS